MRRPRQFSPTSPRDVIRRTAVRVGCCAGPYLLATAAADHFWDDERLIRSPFFAFCVFVVPGAGLALDLWRLRRTRSEGPA